MGWDPERQNAWKMDSRAQFRDFAACVKAPPNAAPSDPVEAHFADGTVFQIPGYTCADLAGADSPKEEPEPQQLPDGGLVTIKSPCYHGRLPDGGLVTIKDRKNGGVRFLAVVCPEGQIAQCRVITSATSRPPSTV